MTDETTETTPAAEETAGNVRAFPAPAGPPPTRGGAEQPRSRGGQKPTMSTTPGLGMTEMEKNAPAFRTPREYQQWLDGKPTRAEVIKDVKKVQEWSAYISARLEQVTEPLEALKRLLVRHNLIRQEEFVEEATLQMNFKRLLDSLNFTPDLPMTDKIAAARSWNNEHPSMKIRGGYIRDLLAFLRDPQCGLSLKERAENASELLVPEEQVLSEEEMAQLAKELAAAPITEAEAATSPEEAKEILATVGGKTMAEIEEIVRNTPPAPVTFSEGEIVRAQPPEVQLSSIVEPPKGV